MYLHEDRELFRDTVLQVSDEIGRTPVVVEKDYYVTLILKLLSEQLNKSKRYSRHLYDVYKLTPMLKLNDEFLKLVDEVRVHRAKMSICPSAKEEVNVSAIILEFCDNGFYQEDYQSITSYFAADYISYEDVIQNIRRLAEGGFFE